MKNNTTEIISLIAVVLFLVLGIGVAIGFSLGAQFPETDWAVFASSIAQILAVIGTIAGAYWLASLQKRKERAEKKERLYFLVDSIAHQITESLDYAPSFKPFTLIDDAEIGLKNLENLPFEYFPGNCLNTRVNFIETSREIIKDIQTWESAWDENKETQSPFIYTLKKDYIRRVRSTFLESIDHW